VFCLYLLLFVVFIEIYLFVCRSCCPLRLPERSGITVRWRVEVARSAVDAPSSAAPAPRSPRTSEGGDACRAVAIS
jgi:hypothetical protein